MKIAVVIPAYNEALRIGSVLKDIPPVLDGHDVIKVVVDDGSKDQTSKIAKSIEGVLVFRHRTNLGKGAAAKTGCDAAIKLKVDAIVLMDGDGQHCPSEIIKIARPVIGSKKPLLVVGKRSKSKEMPLTMRFGNATLSKLTKVFFKINVEDTQSGFRCFHTSIYPHIRWNSADYGMETEMLILASHNKIAHKEVKIKTIYHDSYKGTTAVDGLRVLIMLLKWRLLWSREYKRLESYSA
jgi:glycosyltransferase involved in cell wall biosynthesis